MTKDMRTISKDSWIIVAALMFSACGCATNINRGKSIEKYISLENFIETLGKKERVKTTISAYINADFQSDESDYIFLYKNSNGICDLIDDKFFVIDKKSFSKKSFDHPDLGKKEVGLHVVISGVYNRYPEKMSPYADIIVFFDGYFRNVSVKRVLGDSCERRRINMEE